VIGGERREGLGEAGASAHGEAFGVAGDGRQLGHAAEVAGFGRPAVLLVDPQSHVGGAGNHQGIGPRGPARQGLGERGRAPDRAAGAFEPGARVVAQGGQPGGQRREVEGPRRHGGQSPSGIDDGPVAGAAAQVARDGGLRLLAAERARRAAIGVVEGEQRHHEAWRAEAALRGMVIDHGLLHRVQGAVGRGQVLDREHRTAIDRRQRPDAAVDRPQHRAFAVEFADHDRAGAAVALGAALAGAVATAGAQPVEQHRVGVDAIDARLAQAAQQTQGTDGQGHRRGSAGRRRARRGGCRADDRPRQAGIVMISLGSGLRITVWQSRRR
jgi:hypothetical protein